MSEIWDLPLIRCLAYMSIPMWIAINFVDYLFFKTMDEIFIDQDKLTGFLGMLGSIFSIAGLALQLLITRALLQRYGVGSAILVHPISVSIGSVLLFFRSIFTAKHTESLTSYRSISAIVASFSDEGVAYSVGESASQLLFNAIPDNKRGQSRAFIRGIIEPSCSIFASIILLVLLFLNFSELIFTIVLLLTCLIWIYYGLRIKKNYLQTLVNNLGSPSFDLRSAAISQLSNFKDPTTTKNLLDGVASSDEGVALFALEILTEGHPGYLAEKLALILPDVAPKVKIAILSILSDSNEVMVVDKISPLLKSRESTIRAAAVKSVGKLGGFNELKELEEYINDPDINVRAEVIISLINWNMNSDKKLLNVEEILIQMSQDKEKSVHAKAAYIIGEVRVKELITILIKLSDSYEEEVQFEVIKASGKIGDQTILPSLVKFLKTDNLMHHVIEAIVNFGEVALETLHSALMHSDSSNYETKKHIIYCLGKMGNPNSIPILVNFLVNLEPTLLIEETTITALNSIKSKLLNDSQLTEEEIFSKYFNSEIIANISRSLLRLSMKIEKELSYLTNLRNIKNQEAVKLLIDDLERMSQQGESIAFRYLSLLGIPRSISIATVKLGSENKRDRAEALEVIEGSCEVGKDIAKVLEAKYLPSSLIFKRVSLKELFDDLILEEEETWLRICTVYSVGELRLKELGKKLVDLHKELDRDPRDPLALKNHVDMAIQKLGIQDISTIDEKESKKMELNMKRILFLRSVPLFADVDGNDLKWINEIITERKYSKGNVVFQENDEGNEMFVIEEGSVRVTTGEDNRVTLAVLGDRECFGEMAILDGEPRSATVETVKNSKFYVINRFDFQDLLLARPKIAFALIRTLNQRLRSTLTTLTTIQKKSTIAN